MTHFPHPLTTPPAPTRSGLARRPRASQRGAFFISFALMLTVVLGFVGMALDVGQIYNRKTELQNIADSAALAAAAALDGSAAGVDRAVAAAASAAGWRVYRYVQPVQWSDAAISFAATLDADASGWLSASTAKASPANMLFAKVDTGALDPAHGLVATPFISALVAGPTSASTSGSAVAGRMSIPVTPLGICALDPANRTSKLDHGSGSGPWELVEYGFRRGVGYNLLNLNPLGITPLHFLIDPIDAAGTNPANFATDIVAPFVCSGTMPMWRLPEPPATLHVQSPFPGALSGQLNSRFNQYPGGVAPCDPTAAPPDVNVRAFLPASAGWWTIPTPLLGQTAVSTNVLGHLGTIADPGVPIAGVSAGSYGVLWSYGPAVRYADPEPAGGYSPFAKADWSTLYPTTTPPTPVMTSAYTPAPFTPYTSTAGAFFMASSSVHPGLRPRRVLNIPLFACTNASAANATATVLGVGRFFMTAPATPTAISAEFAGLAEPQHLVGPVSLYQ